ncbi:murein L,D-transpeptidase [Arenibacter sp. TNZ]|jgi:L,D-transpeptidase ErfK/SrfK|uniref:L,D-transpeptidase n=1 Tax=Arenibacter TaxID=178469 RepID=UPI000CD3C5A8|nr:MULTISPECIES: L,D-transpeptidase [Arenibacter]MCM4173893.1 murein L,D-transpeptidase [Arenibacter sp. TNZ]
MIKHYTIILIFLTLLVVSCNVNRPISIKNTSIVKSDSTAQKAEEQNNSLKKSKPIQAYINRDITVGHYFKFMDSLANKNDSLVPYTLSEHILVRANPWIMDTLANTDYYRQMALDSFVYDQRKMIVLKAHDSLLIPDADEGQNLIRNIENTWIDVNIPEYKLRIYQDSLLLYTIPIRVGQHRKRYLAMGDRVTDLRTKTGKGKIVRVERNPSFYNPVTGKRFYVTKRDDKKTTIMPVIPWIETEINGIRNGQMIHPTTNPVSLGKAYSNGCIGVTEADAWIIYYHAPLNTPIQIRYNLTILDDNGEKQELEDIYGYQ